VRVVVFGAGGKLGTQIVNELLRRGHTVRAVVRRGKRSRPATRAMPVVIADVTDADSVAEAVRGADAVVSAVGPGPDEDLSVLTDAATALIKGLGTAGVHRLIVVGGAGSLEVSPGVQLLETPEFPAAWKPVAEAHREALGLYRKEPDLEWTVVSPAAMIVPGERTGHYRAGGDQLLVDAKGESRISAEDYAVAVADELETPRHIRRRFTVAAP
jgi:uncharacterized protein